MLYNRSIEIIMPTQIIVFKWLYLKSIVRRETHTFFEQQQCWRNDFLLKILCVPGSWSCCNFLQ